VGKETAGGFLDENNERFTTNPNNYYLIQDSNIHSAEAATTQVIMYLMGRKPRKMRIILFRKQVDIADVHNREQLLDYWLVLYAARCSLTKPQGSASVMFQCKKYSRWI